MYLEYWDSRWYLGDHSVDVNRWPSSPRHAVTSRQLEESLGLGHLASSCSARCFGILCNILEFGSFPKAETDGFVMFFDVFLMFLDVFLMFFGDNSGLTSNPQTSTDDSRNRPWPRCPSSSMDKAWARSPRSPGAAIAWDDEIMIHKSGQIIIFH